MTDTTTTERCIACEHDACEQDHYLDGAERASAWDHMMDDNLMVGPEDGPHPNHEVPRGHWQRTGRRLWRPHLARGSCGKS